MNITTDGVNLTSNGTISAMNFTTATISAMNFTTAMDLTTIDPTSTTNTTGFIPSEDVYRHRIQAGYVVVGFVIGLLLLLVVFLIYISRKEIFLRCKKYLGPMYQVEVSAPGPQTSYEYLEGYNSDHVNRHIDRTKAADF